MAVHQDPNLDDDGSSNRSSSFQRTVSEVFLVKFLVFDSISVLIVLGLCLKVILRDWWLIKCSKEFKGKRFGVAGNESEASVVE